LITGLYIRCFIPVLLNADVYSITLTYITIVSYEASSSSLSNQILAVEAIICEMNKQRTEGTPRRGGMSGSVERRPVSPLDPQMTLRQRLNNKLIV